MIRELLAFVTPRFIENAPQRFFATVPEHLSFSDAILRGCQLTHPNSAVYLSKGGACVLGAAVVGAGWTDRSWDPMRPGGREFYERYFGPLGELHNLYANAYGRRTSFERDFANGISREEIARRFKALGR